MLIVIVKPLISAPHGVPLIAASHVCCALRVKKAFVLHACS